MEKQTIHVPSSLRKNVCGNGDGVGGNPAAAHTCVEHQGRVGCGSAKKNNIEAQRAHIHDERSSQTMEVLCVRARRKCTVPLPLPAMIRKKEAALEYGKEKETS